MLGVEQRLTTWFEAQDGVNKKSSLKSAFASLPMVGGGFSAGVAAICAVDNRKMPANILITMFCLRDENALGCL